MKKWVQGYQVRGSVKEAVEGTRSLLLLPRSVRRHTSDLEGMPHSGRHRRGGHADLRHVERGDRSDART